MARCLCSVLIRLRCGCPINKTDDGTDGDRSGFAHRECTCEAQRCAWLHSVGATGIADLHGRNASCAVRRNPHRKIHGVGTPYHERHGQTINRTQRGIRNAHFDVARWWLVRGGW